MTLVLLTVTFLWPFVSLIMQLVSERAGAASFTMSGRYFVITLRTVGLAAAAAVLCIMLAIVPSWWLAGRTRWWTAATLAAALVCPPMVLTFAWNNIIGSAIPGRLQCILVWALWLWPVPAVLIGIAWRRTGKDAYEAALLDASRAAAFVRVGLPAVLPSILISAVAVFMICVSDYGVPHAFGLIVASTEILGWATSSDSIRDVVGAAAMPMVFTAIGALCIIRFAGREWGRSPDPFLRQRDDPATLGGVAVSVLVLVTLVIPLAYWLGARGSWSAVAIAYRTYGVDLWWSLGVAGTGALLAALLAIGAASLPRPIQLAVLIIAVLAGLAPGGLVGAALVFAYNRGLTVAIYDDWPILVICYATRFAWLPMALMWLLIRRDDQGMAELARLDGCTRPDYLLRIVLPAYWPHLLAASGLVTALALAEVPASTLVRSPRFAPVAHVLIEKFHRFEDGMLTSLCLWLVLAAFLAASAAVIIVRSRASRV